MNTENKTKRRIIVPKKVDIVDDLPDTASMMEDALTILRNDLTHFKTYTNNGKKLAPQEARVINQHIKSLMDISREKRAREDIDPFSNMSDDEIEKALESLGYVKKSE